MAMSEIAIMQLRWHYDITDNSHRNGDEVRTVRWMKLLKHAKDDGNATDASMPVNVGLTWACPSCKKKACEVLLITAGQLPTKATRNDSSDQGEQLCNQSLLSFLLIYIH